MASFLKELDREIGHTQQRLESLRSARRLENEAVEARRKASQIREEAAGLDRQIQDLRDEAGIKTASAALILDQHGIWDELCKRIPEI